MGFLKNKGFRQRETGEHQPCQDAGRRAFLKKAAKAAAIGSTAMVAGCQAPGLLGSKEEMALQFQEYFKAHYRLMTEQERDATITRLERLAKLQKGVDVQISSKDAIPGVLYGYGFNVTRCEGYMECVSACVKENNLDRKSNTQYIRIFEMEPGQMTPDAGKGKFFNEVPVDGRFYMEHSVITVTMRPASRLVPPRPLTENPMELSWWTMTGASDAGTVWPRVLTMAAGSIGTSRLCRQMKSPKSSTISATGSGAGGRWKNAPSACSEPAKAGCRPVQKRVLPGLEFSETCWIPLVKSGLSLKTKKYSGGKKNWEPTQNFGTLLTKRRKRNDPEIFREADVRLYD